MQAEIATFMDLDVIADLLAESSLPIVGIASKHVRFMVLREGSSIIAAAAIEGEAPDGLLRSVVVDQDFRQKGIGAAFIDRVISEANKMGYTSLFLLTETAASFFERLGFDTISRNEAPASIQSSIEFDHLCPASATCMTLLLSSYKSKYYAKR